MVSTGFSAAMASFDERYGGEVEWTLDGHVATITMNRQEAMNTMGGRLNAGVTEALDWCADEQQVRVVVFTGGTGRAFCAGGDLGGGSTGKGGKKTEGGASGGFKAAGGTVQQAVR